MAKKYLDENGLLYLWQKIKAKFISDITYNSTSKKIQKTQNGTTSDVVTLSKVATSNNYNDLDNRPTIPSGVEKTTTTPKMDGTAAVGSETKFAAGDHIHPSDTSRVPTTRTINDIALDTDITLGSGDIGYEVVEGGTFDDAGVEVINVEEALNVVDGILFEQASDISNKVDKVTGKGLSTNDYTTAEKTKLAGIASGAEVNVQADWNETNTSSDAYIKNKPTIPSGVVVDDELSMTSTNPVQNRVIYTALKEKDAFVAIIDVTNYADVKEAYELGKRVYAVDDNDMYTSSGVGFWNLVYYSATEQYFRFQYFWFDENADYPVLQDISLNVNDEWLPSFPEFSIASSDVVTTDYKGLMSPSDKTKLNKLLFDSNNLIDSSILPSYVDDVIEAYPRSGQTPLSQNWLATGSASGTVITPEAGKIYVLMADSGDYTTNTQFRWSGTTYVKLNDGGVTNITNAEIDTIIAS